MKKVATSFFLVFAFLLLCGCEAPWSRIYFFKLPNEIEGRTRVDYEFFVYPWESYIHIGADYSGVRNRCDPRTMPVGELSEIIAFYDGVYVDTHSRAGSIWKDFHDYFEPVEFGTHTFYVILEKQQLEYIKRNKMYFCVLVNGDYAGPWLYRSFNRDVKPVRTTRF